MENEKVLVLDFGGQYNQLIARRVRDLNVYCELKPCTISIEKIREMNPKGIIFTGGPNSVYDEKAPHIDPEIFNLNIPILGICYGCQLIAYTLGGEVKHAETREYGKQQAKLDASSKLFKGLKASSQVWMSHTDYIDRIPDGFKVVATTKTCPVAAMENKERKIYGVQYHPEVVHSLDGNQMLRNFLYEVVGVKGDWTMDNFAKETIKALKEKIGDKKVLCAFSGGVDSAVAATLVHKAVGSQLTCIFVDHGLLPFLISFVWLCGGNRNNKRRIGGETFNITAQAVVEAVAARQ